jgi:CubicO group peptidase (beta-lactamase class C family)
LPGGVDGVTLLPSERVAAATALQKPDGIAPEKDPPMRVGLGYGLGEPGSAMGTGKAAFGHSGAGGSIGFADPEYQLAFAFTHNLFSQANAAVTLADEIRRLLRKT